MALLYGISVTTVYRTLRAFQKPHTAHRRDRGKPQVLPPSELEHYCELIAALKLRTTNKAGRHLSTTRAIQLLEEHGVETAQGLVKLPQGLLCRPTVIQALAQQLNLPISALSGSDLKLVTGRDQNTLIRSEVFARVREYFRNNQSGEDHAG